MSLTLTAPRLRIILSVSMVVTLSLSIAGIYLIYTNLNKFAGEVSQATGEAASGQVNLLALQTVSQKLKTQTDAITRAQKIVADSKSYQYQEPVITDLNGFAKDAGVVISSFNFITAPTNPAGSAALSKPGGVTPLVSASMGGIKSTTVTITLKSPVDYTRLLKFIRRIENNPTRMQVSKLALTRDPTTGGVMTDTLAVGVYMR